MDTEEQSAVSATKESNKFKIEQKGNKLSRKEEHFYRQTSHGGGDGGDIIYSIDGDVMHQQFC